MKNLKKFLFENKSFIIVYTFIITFISINFTANAQDWNKLKEKAKSTGNNVVNDAKNTNTNSNNNNTINNSNNNTNTNVINTTDNSYSDFVDQKYSILFSADYDLFPDFIESITYEIDPVKHLEGAKLLEYPATLKKLKENGQKNSDKYKYEKLITFESRYTTIFNDKIKVEINQYIEQAYSDKKYNTNEAINKCNLAKKFAEAAFLIIPDNQDVIKIKQDADNAFNDIAGSYYSQIYTGNFHKENAGKIFFSKQPVEVWSGKENSSMFKNEFTMNDNVYAYVYLNGTIKDLGGSEGKYIVTIDNSTTEYITFGHNEEDINKSYYYIEILPSPDKSFHGLDPIEFGNIISNLSPRRHEIKIEFSAGYSEPFAVGTFNIDLTGMDSEKVKTNAKNASNNAKDNYDKNRTLPEEFSMPNKKYTDPELSETNIRTIVMANFDNCLQILKVVVPYTSPNGDWMIYTTDAGIPRYKATSTSTYAVYKGKDGWCYYVTGVVFTRDYEGGGKYSKVKFMTSNRPVRIDCSRVK